MAELTKDDQPVEMRIGDTLTLSFLWRKPNRKEVRVLTDYAARVRFWYDDTDPHVERAAFVDGANGLVYYDLQGDEYQLDKVTFAQAQVVVPKWYVNAADGRDYRKTSSDIFRFIVRSAPS